MKSTIFFSLFLFFIKSNQLKVQWNYIYLFVCQCNSLWWIVIYLNRVLWSRQRKVLTDFSTPIINQSAYWQCTKWRTMKRIILFSIFFKAKFGQSQCIKNRRTTFPSSGLIRWNLRWTIHKYFFLIIFIWWNYLIGREFLLDWTRKLWSFG